MKIHILKAGQGSPTHSFDEVRALVAQNHLIATDLIWYEGCPEWIEARHFPGLFACGGPPPAGPRNAILKDTPTDDLLIRRIADYQRVSGILWICIGAIQLLTVVGIIAGAWNIYAGITRINSCKFILARGPHVPRAFESVTQLIVIGLINLLIGGVIGILFVAFDFYIRDLVLKNASLFRQSQPEGRVG